MDLGLKDKIAIVSGASKGIGKAIALELAREGCKVILCARGEEDLQDAANEVGEVGYASAVPADVTKAEEVERLVGETVDRHGGVDILVNNAGGIGRPAAFEELSDEEWYEVLDLNLLSAVRFTRAVLPQMRKQRWGRIINVASESGIQPDPFMPHYNASKAALINLTKSLSKAFGPEGILVNAVSPAFVMTPLVESMLADEAEQKGASLEEVEAAFLKENRPNIVVGRAGTSEETASVVAFLASERASFVAGANYRVDGGSVASIS
jgi:NAD(P)-dependent dehydrogenase (short-subunit alcohol dehydrogenase family)